MQIIYNTPSPSHEFIMIKESNRIHTIIALLTASGVAAARDLNAIKTELQDLLAANRVSPQKRKFILKVLHTTRSVDSMLKAFVVHHHIVGTKHSIGGYLHQLERHTNASLHKLSASERAYYQHKIGDIRNEHMHNANHYPSSERDVNALINEMHVLMARVFALPK